MRLRKLRCFFSTFQIDLNLSARLINMQHNEYINLPLLVKICKTMSFQDNIKFK